MARLGMKRARAGNRGSVRNYFVNALIAHGGLGWPRSSKLMSVLVVGAGPVGLMLAAELHRHGSPCRAPSGSASSWCRAAVRPCRAFVPILAELAGLLSVSARGAAGVDRV